jgi:hypothetical protein
MFYLLIHWDRNGAKLVAETPAAAEKKIIIEVKKK